MQKIIVLVALEMEFSFSRKPFQKVFYTGIGKINASRATTDLILMEKPDLILNVGTAGTLKREMLGCVFGIRDVIERDMIAKPLAPRGMVPLSTQEPLLKSDFGTVRCASDDSFVTTKDVWLEENAVDMVDMELFAIAKVAEYYGVKWRAIKFASDLADGSAMEHWTTSLAVANEKINEMMDIALQA
jgi:adenosylhomocysteine nucleosidase